LRLIESANSSAGTFRARPKGAFRGISGWALIQNAGDR